MLAVLEDETAFLLADEQPGAAVDAQSVTKGLWYCHPPLCVDLHSDISVSRGRSVTTLP